MKKKDTIAVKNIAMPYVILPRTVPPGDSWPLVTSIGSQQDSLLKEIAEMDTTIFLSLPDDTHNTDPSAIRPIGTIARVECVEAQDDLAFFKLHAVDRGRVKNTIDEFLVEVERHPYVNLHAENNDTEVKALAEEVSRNFCEYYRSLDGDEAHKVGPEMQAAETPMEIAAAAEASLSLMKTLPNERRQQILEMDTISKRLKAMHKIIVEQLKVQRTRVKIQATVSTKISRENEIFALQREAAVIEKERKRLGDPTVGDDDLDELKKQLAKAKLPDGPRQRVDKEMKRLAKMSSQSPEYHNLQKYIETLLDMPWDVVKEVNNDLRLVRERLKQSLFGMDELIDVLVECAAIHISNPDAKEIPLNLIGPPGVGKTSIGQAYADARELEFIHIALGGESNEAKIRGHSRTYVSAMMGQIAKGIRNARSANPVIMLDEIDKLLSSPHGDPEAALLEVLDPAQNHKFKDNYLDESFDLSKVKFICTANNPEKISRPLLDRMENFFVEGYIAHEKVEIARRHLLPQQMKECGLTPDKVTVTDHALSAIIHHYTKEAGVRKLKEHLHILCRKVNLALLEGSKTAPVTVTADNLSKIIGEYKIDNETIAAEDQIGVMSGLYYSDAGGGLLTIEATVEKEGKGEFTSSGNLLGSMKESIDYIQRFIKENADKLKIDMKALKTRNIHAHFPAAATPKDGPSAGAATAVALVSAITGRKIRRDVAMTGELSAKGYVLPIGGLKQKFEGAVNAGIKTIIIPQKNSKDLAKIPDSIKDKLEIVLVSHFSEVMPRVFADTMMGRVGRQTPVRPIAIPPTMHDCGPTREIQPVLQ